jgi:DNA-binding NarL/FixJ family response regulator
MSQSRKPNGQFGDSDGTLSDRQRDVFARVCRGDSIKGIAHDLGVNRSTVKHHITTGRKKLGARNTTHAAVLFDRSHQA